MRKWSAAIGILVLGVTCPLIATGARAGAAPLNIAVNASGEGMQASTVLTMAAGVPAAPPATWCETGIKSPYTSPPAGAVIVPKGNNSTQPFMQNYTAQANKVYWFAPGVHTLGRGKFAGIAVADGDVFVGAPGAVIDGKRRNLYAFSALSTTSPEHAVIEYLTIEHFTAGTGEMVIGQSGYNGWTIEHNIVENNSRGAGIGLGTNAVVEDNCTRFNGEYGYSSIGGSSNITFEYNDVYDNNNRGYYDIPHSKVQCGCSGGGKIWMSTDVAIDHNYIHSNIGAGVWPDTDNAGIDISENWITGNWSCAICYEISYNGNITDNYIAGNAYGDVTTNDSPSFPAAAIYLNSSSASSAVASAYESGPMQIAGNDLVNNWGGIVVFQDSNRVCGFSSDGTCTLPAGNTFTLSSCQSELSGRTQAQAEALTPDYYDDCQWKAQNIEVTDNTFDFDPQRLLTGPFTGRADTCASANSRDDTLCGVNGMFAYYGSLSFLPTTTVDVNVSDQQNNIWSDNTYNGPSQFDAFNQSNIVNWGAWHSGFTFSPTGQRFDAEDAGSSYSPTCSC